MEQPVEQCPETEELVPCDPCVDNEGTSIDALPTDGSEVDPPPDEVSESEPEEVEQLQQAPVEGNPAGSDPEKTAPLAEQERDSGLHVPPPSPNNGNTDNEDESKIIVNDNEPEIPDVPTPEKEDIVFVEQEIVPQDQSTPKKVEEKKDKREKKEKKPKEKKEKKDKKDKKKEKKEETEEEPLTEMLPRERKPYKFRPSWTIPPVYK